MNLSFPRIRRLKVWTPGFTLIELLSVIAIISVLATVGNSLLSGGNRAAAKLTSAGNLIVDIANRARQNSMSKGVMTAVVMAKSLQATDSNYRSLALMEKASGDTEWKPLTPWIFLPAGITVDPVKSANFIHQRPLFTPVPDNLPRLGSGSPSATDCAYQVYLPDGRLSVNGISPVPDSPSLHLVEKVRGTGSANYYRVVLNLLTGMPRIERP
ncbi:MAG TPA: prepilin-type N-terminal cleavage/methylation domain-containing protein [Candidatus Methylacidiphilales bacterium]|nr:prepilin-type N-terminal cleavage/methylation domain-containing protein [Candidatus Methylacidiphilales bacterium]